MPTKEQLESALVNADAAGDFEAARSLANALKRGEYDTPTAVDAPFDPNVALAETVGTMLTGAIAEPVAGIAGLAATPFMGAEKGAEVVESVREGMTYEPKTSSGKKALGAIGETLSPFAEYLKTPFDALSNWTLDVTGSPAAATAVHTAPAAALELIALKGLKSVRSGVKLLDDTGNPTPALRKALEKQGLVYENLTPEAKTAIPKVADKKLLPAPKSELGQQAESALKEQIKAGGRDDALAQIKLLGDDVVSDPVAKAAVKQGFSDGLVQSVKTSSPATKLKMKQMLDMQRRIKGMERLGLDMRPGDIAGDSLLDRFKHIRQAVKQNRIRLDQIANKELKGLPVSGDNVVNALESALTDLDVKLVGDGVPTPVFKGSMISKDKASQKVIKDLIDLMSEGGAPDALRMHKLKRQLDNMIDYRKVSGKGLSKAGEGVLRDIREELNNTLRTANPEYAEVNDILSSSLGAFDDFTDAAGRKLDVFGEGGDKALGQKLRSLMSNIQSRVALENSVNNIDDLAANLGGKFDDDIRDLVMFANALDDRFGATAKTSFKGQIESAINRSAQQGMKATAGEAVVSKIAEKAEALRGINDNNAFQAMFDLLNDKTP